MTSAGVLTTLYSFCMQAGCTDGSNPLGGLIQASDGNFYGTTHLGGSSGNCSGGCGTIFKITSAGVLTVLHSFSGADGAYPLGTLVQATKGGLYGTTTQGGSFSCGTAYIGCGTVFQVTTSGKFKSLFSFSPEYGSNPYGGLIDVKGKFYGTAYFNGTSTNCNFFNNGCGTVFSIDTAGVVTVLHNFDGYDGANPFSGLTLGATGKLYGTASYGGGCFGDSWGCHDSSERRELLRDDR